MESSNDKPNGNLPPIVDATPLPTTTVQSKPKVSLSNGNKNQNLPTELTPNRTILADDGKSKDGKPTTIWTKDKDGGEGGGGGEGDEEGRDTWDNPLEFLLSVFF